MENLCMNCKHFRQLKELEKGIWIIKGCCTLNPDTDLEENSYDSFVIVCRYDSTCENFEEDKKGRKYKWQPE